MSLINYNPWSLSSRDFDPFGHFEHQMRHMVRDFDRLERQLLGDQLGGQNRDQYPLGLTSLMDRGAIAPRIVEQDGQKLAQYNFDVRGFRPEDVNIRTTKDHHLVVTGRHREAGDNFESFREFHRIVALPQDIKLEDMKSRLSNEGVLTITTPVSQLALDQNQPHELPIQHETVKCIQ